MYYYFFPFLCKAPVTKWGQGISFIIVDVVSKVYESAKQ